MKIKIVSNYRGLANTQFSTTEEVVPGVGDEVIWECRDDDQPTWVGRFRGIVRKRTIDYTIPPTRTDRFEVTLDMLHTQPIFEETP